MRKSKNFVASNASILNSNVCIIDYVLTTLYELLGVDHKAKPVTLRAAYRRLARTHHPDVNPDPKSHERMAKINSAFETLIDPVRRMEYDSGLNGGLVTDPTPEYATRVPDAVKVRLLRRLVDHKTPIYSICFAPGTDQMISSAFDNEIIWWDLEGGVPERRVRVDGGVVNTITAIQDDSLLAAGCSESSISYWKLQGDKVVHSNTRPTEWPCCIKISTHGERLATGSVNRVLYTLKTKSGDAVFSSSGHADTVTAIAWSHDDRLIATGGADAAVKIWGAESGQEFHTFSNVRSTVTAMAFNSDSTMLAVAAVDLSIRIFSLRSKQLTMTFFGHERPIESLAFHPSSWLLASVARDGCVGLFDVARGVGHGKIEASHLPLSSIAFSEDGSRMAAGGIDKVLRVWSLVLK